MTAYIAYIRVSTDKQGRSGLGLDAQHSAVAAHIAAHAGELIATYEEIESGKRADRPQLVAALAECRARRAVLIIAKLDRLARNVRFLLSVVEGCGDGGVVFCDLPQMPAGAMSKFIMTVMAAVAELEAGLISQRTIAALAAARARGVRLGGPNMIGADSRAAAAGRAMQTARRIDHARTVLPYLADAAAAGAVSLRQMAAALTARGVRTPRGGERWGAQQVRQVLATHQTRTAR